MVRVTPVPSVVLRRNDYDVFFTSSDTSAGRYDVII